MVEGSDIPPPITTF